MGRDGQREPVQVEVLDLDLGRLLLNEARTGALRDILHESGYGR